MFCTILNSNKIKTKSRGKMQNVELLSVKIAPVNLSLNNNAPKKICTASFERIPFLKN